MGHPLTSIICLQRYEKLAPKIEPYIEFPGTTGLCIIIVVLALAIVSLYLYCARYYISLLCTTYV